MTEELKSALVGGAGFVGTFVAVIWTAVAAFRKQRDKAMKAADHPSGSGVPPMLPPPPSPELLELRKRMAEVEGELEHERDLVRLRWKYQDSLEDRRALREELERLQDAVTTRDAALAQLRAENRLLRSESDPTLRPPRLPRGSS